ncbi:MAG TPA: acyl-CoA carboxylase subunit epsilon [Pseudonocardiaceae bacterium]|jgi:hypothetical protein|nr:acyl-CoA carboxylase subunit epsilon [Pseudonocardiaceae bacterium]
MSGDDGVQDVQPSRPLLRVVRGTPDEAELAALTAVVASISVRSTEQSAPEPAPSAWADRESLARRPLAHGPGAWRASGLPR